jgi:hypothetical protein
MFIEGQAQIPPSIGHRRAMFRLVIAEFFNSALVTWPLCGGRILFQLEAINMARLTAG